MTVGSGSGEGDEVLGGVKYEDRGEADGPTSESES